MNSHYVTTIIRHCTECLLLIEKTKRIQVQSFLLGIAIQWDAQWSWVLKWVKMWRVNTLFEIFCVFIYLLCVPLSCFHFLLPHDMDRINNTHEHYIWHGTRTAPPGKVSAACLHRVYDHMTESGWIDSSWEKELSRAGRCVSRVEFPAKTFISPAFLPKALLVDCLENYLFYLNERSFFIVLCVYITFIKRDYCVSIDMENLRILSWAMDTSRES